MAGRGAVWHLFGVRHLGLRVGVVFPMHTVYQGGIVNWHM